MSTWERKDRIKDSRIGEGFEVTYDKWHEVHYRGKLVGTFGCGLQERERAILSTVPPEVKTRYERLME